MADESKVSYVSVARLNNDTGSGHARSWPVRSAGERGQVRALGLVEYQGEAPQG